MLLSIFFFAMFASPAYIHEPIPSVVAIAESTERKS